MIFLKLLLIKCKRLFFPALVEPVFLLRCLVHGTHYYDCQELLFNKDLVVGEALLLLREPTNEEDFFAIEIKLKNGKKLGYVPKKHNKVIANIMDNNSNVIAKIDGIQQHAWDPIIIKIYLQQL